MSATTTTGNRRRGPSKGDAREAAILRTLEELLTERPYSSVGIDELATGAGISRSAFYFYFASKDAVLAALLEGLEASIVAENSDWYEGSYSALPEAEAALRRSLTHSAGLWSSRGALLRLACLGSDVPASVTEFRARSMHRQQHGTVERIERDRAAGLAPPGPPTAGALASAVLAVRTALLAAAFAPSAPSPVTVGRGTLVDDLLAAQLRLLYGVV
jgi:TetR/AcrR family transcriptional regulator, ethionamide resistance regulator